MVITQVKEEVENLPLHTLVKEIMTDNGGEFKGVLDKWLKTQGTSTIKTKARDPHTNGSAERTVR